MPARRAISCQLQGEVVHMLAVIEEIAADLVALVSEAEDEPAKSEVAVGLHDMPQDWLATNIDQRLGQFLARFPEPSAHAAAQDDDRNLRRIKIGIGYLGAHYFPPAFVADLERQAPGDLNTDITVNSKIFRSSHRDQFSI